jgi:hypothetical protein
MRPQFDFVLVLALRAVAGLLNRKAVIHRYVLTLTISRSVGESVDKNVIVLRISPGTMPIIEES